MTIVREFREAWRRLMRRPGYALLSVLVLGVGLGEPLWRNSFGADPHIIGRAIRADGIWATMVGVVPGRKRVA